MRLQLRLLFALGVIAWFALRTTTVWAQSTVKYKRMLYDEAAPGIRVDEDALEVLLELENQDEASFLMTHDVISGASPIGLPEGDVIGGASTAAVRGQLVVPFEDTRTGVALGYKSQLVRTFALGGTASYSEEDDYISRGLSLSGTLELNAKNTTISPSISYYSDSVMPVEKPQQEKKTTGFSLGLSQVINSWNLGELGMDLSRASGYLTDPYKQVLVGVTALPETRPDERISVAFRAGLRTKPFPNHAAWLRGRFYMDDWEVYSLTGTASTFHQLDEKLLVELFYRYYRQTEAFFWADSFEGTDQGPYRSADVRLARLTSARVGITTTWRKSDQLWWIFSFARYGQSGIPEGTAPLDPNIATISAIMASIAVQYRFY